mmetsp:Transcript_8594/g.18765  ORF Transcript_8594/g.18765 Transcript_8594/m.18765 type:complete len:200 (-) Transcript_8594:1363-1962(-)
MGAGLPRPPTGRSSPRWCELRPSFRFSLAFLLLSFRSKTRQDRSSRPTACEAAHRDITGEGTPFVSQLCPLGSPSRRKFIISLQGTPSSRMMTRQPWHNAEAMGYGHGCVGVPFSSVVNVIRHTAKQMMRRFRKSTLRSCSSNSFWLSGSLVPFMPAENRVWYIRMASFFNSALKNEVSADMSSKRPASKWFAQIRGHS